MSRRVEHRLRSLERMTRPASHAVGCPACENWRTEWVEAGTPYPPRQCDHCGRQRPRHLIVIEVVPTTDNRTEARP